MPSRIRTAVIPAGGVGACVLPLSLIQGDVTVPQSGEGARSATQSEATAA